ncbi:hypothetical protein ACFV99_10500 [Streptomyces sp. NPDC059944]
MRLFDDAGAKKAASVVAKRGCTEFQSVGDTRPAAVERGGGLISRG